MGLIVTSTLALVLWIVLWALHFAARDAGIIAFVIVLAATAVRTVGQQLRQSSDLG
ncbi:MAG: hypothetical protein AAGC46_14015 [Solirubrobacteraceae bacterium]|nr:hypothetical protein [Patulibacter sp.]